MTTANFINKLRQSDERVKLRWAYGITGGVVLVMFLTWAVFGGAVLHGNDALLLGKTDSGSVGWIKTFKAGATAIIDMIRLRTANTIFYFKEKFGRKNTIYIEGGAEPMQENKQTEVKGVETPATDPQQLKEIQSLFSNP